MQALAKRQGRPRECANIGWPELRSWGAVTSESWRQIEQLYHAAGERAPAERAALFAGVDAEVRSKPEKARALLEGMRASFEKNYTWRHAWAILLAAEGKRKEALEAMDEDTLKYARLTW